MDSLDRRQKLTSNASIEADAAIEKFLREYLLVKEKFICVIKFHANNRKRNIHSVSKRKKDIYEWNLYIIPIQLLREANNIGIFRKQLNKKFKTTQQKFLFLAKIKLLIVFGEVKVQFLIVMKI